MNKPSDTSLKQIIGFTEKDLATNRDGDLSDNQKRKIHNGQMLAAMFWWGLAVIWALLLVSSSTWDKDGSDAPIFILLAAGSVGMAFWQQNQTRQVLHNDGVSKIQGSLQKSRHYANKNWHYFITIRHKKFNVSNRIQDAFDQGRVYILYYTPTTDQILSVETVERERHLMREIQQARESALDDDAEQTSRSQA